jgi:haloalkane dehalogenase
METILRPISWGEFPAGARSRFEAYRTPWVGEAMVLDENLFIEGTLRATVLNGLSDEDRAAYQAPYPTRESRRPRLEWPRAMPLDGDPGRRGRPGRGVRRVALEEPRRAEAAPDLRRVADPDGRPGDGRLCASNVVGLEVEPCGAAGHLAPEDQPAAIAARIAAWADRHGLR